MSTDKNGERRSLNPKEHHSAIKKKTRPSAAVWMELEMIPPSEVSQGKADIIRHHLHVESKTGHK